MEIERFSPENYDAQREVLAGILMGVDRYELAKRRRGLIEYRDAFADQERVKLFGVPTDEMRHEDQPAAVDQRSPYLPDREIEGKGMKAGPDVMLVEAEPLPGRREEAGDIVVSDERTFGLAGRARGVDDIGKVVDRSARRGVAVGLRREGGPVPVQAKRAPGVRGELSEQSLLR